MFHVLIGNLGNIHITDIHARLLYQIDQQIKRAFKYIQSDLIRHLRTLFSRKSIPHHLRETFHSILLASETLEELRRI